jgi:hypothetical protein
VTNLKAILGYIKLVVAYVDTVRIFTRRLPKGLFDRCHQLNQMAGRKIAYPEQVWRTDRRTGRRWSPGWSIVLTRPTQELLWEMEQYGDMGRIDIVLEFITDQRETLRLILARDLHVQRGSKRPIRTVEGRQGTTIYKGGRNREVFFYGHRRSKIYRRASCVRLNVSLRRRRSVRTQHLTDVADLIALDPKTFVHHNLRIRLNGKRVRLPDSLVPDHLTWPRQPSNSTDKVLSHDSIPPLRPSTLCSATASSTPSDHPLKTHQQMFVISASLKLRNHHSLKSDLQSEVSSHSASETVVRRVDPKLPRPRLSYPRPKLSLPRPVLWS